MKKILLLSGVIALLSTTGCLVAEDGRHEHGGYERHSEAVIVGPPIVVVRPPEVIVR
jgi:hypothetical protein